jgi:hypothetical protein
MNVPRFWAKEQSEGRRPDGTPVKFAAWRWSSRSIEEAKAKAREAAEVICQAIAAGRPPRRDYAYGSRPLREPIIRSVPEGASPPHALITRNAYGALVLNCEGVMFVDADHQPSIGGLAKRLFKRKGPLDTAIEGAEQLVRERGGGIRLYETRAGVRYLLTDAVFDPAGDETQRIMSALAADPCYMRLCRVQESFRARLTPKPWRCGLPTPPVRWPLEDDDAQRAMDTWLDRYEQACTVNAVCRHRATLGAASVHPRVEEVMTLHDELTGAELDLPLA